MLVLCRKSFKQHFYLLFYFCCKLKRFLHVSLKGEASKALLLRDKSIEGRNETMYCKKKIKLEERRKLCTNLKIITYTRHCIAFTLYTTDLVMEKRVKSLTNTFLRRKKSERIKWVIYIFNKVKR